MKNILHATLLIVPLLLCGCGKENGGTDSWIDFGGQKTFQFSVAQVIHTGDSQSAYHGWGFIFVAVQGGNSLSVALNGYLTETSNPNGSYRITADANDIAESPVGTTCGPASMITQGMMVYKLTGGTLTVNRSGDIWNISVTNGVAVPQNGGDPITVSHSYKGKLTLAPGNDPI